MSKHVGEKCGKQLNGDPDEQSQLDGQIDTRTDGHHFTIIVPSEDGRIILVWFGLLWFNVTFSDRRVYNKNVKS